MISLDLNNQTSSSSPSTITLPPNEEETKLSFSQLLKGAGSKTEAKVIQNGALVLSLEGSVQEGADLIGAKDEKTSSKTSSLLSLLKNEDKEVTNSKEPLEINPKITAAMSAKDIKNLVTNAKDYLKEQIIQSEGYKNSQNKELPTTLKGLAQMAKNFGIDISKITLEEVQVKTPVEKLSTLKTESKISEQNSEVRPETKIEKNVLENSVEKKSTPQPVVETKVAKTVVKPEEAPQVINSKVINTKSEEKITPVAKSSQATPLFKAQATTEHTTEQLVQTKASGLLKVEEKTPKEKADETLQLLLRGEKPTKTNPALTADFSVATARVIASSTTTEATKSLESLLHGESKESNTTATKVDALTTHKADSFEIKLNEAKQMIKYLSNDVKTAIEDYKSPFTRVKVQLNPQKLGEVDVTIVQRGKNLHVNLSSNNTAINTLSMNANELRAQLTNNGINNASLNFNNSSQNSEQNASQQQQNRQNERQAGEEYGYFDNEEANEEILSSLEIVVPNYA